MYFALLVVFLGIAGWIGANRFREIEKTAKEMRNLLDNMKTELSQMQVIKDETQNEIDNIKKKIENESKEFMEVIYNINQGKFEFEKGELFRAIDYFKRIIKVKPESPEAHRLLGNAYSSNGEDEKAIYHLKEAIKLKPDYYEAYLNLGRAYRRYGNFDLAIEYSKKSIELNPKSVLAVEQIGLTFFQKGDELQAEEWYQKVKEIEPNYAMGFLGLARIAYKQGKLDKALEFYKYAKSKIMNLVDEGRCSHWDIYHLAEIHLACNNVDEAESDFNKAFLMNSAYETLRAIKWDLEVLKSSPYPPENIDKFLKIFENKLKKHIELKVL